MFGNQKQEKDKVILEDSLLEKYKKTKKGELLKEIFHKEEELKKNKELLEETKKEIEKMKETEKNYKNQLIRMQADFENFRKREEKKKQEFMEYAKQDLICKLLSVIDNLERAASYSQDQIQEKNVEIIREGIQGILKEIGKILENEGLKPIPAMGEKFDPYCHEAIMQVESEKYPEDTIIEELIKGYYLKSKVIRPSVVKVSKGYGEKNQDKERQEPESSKDNNENNK